MFPITFVPLKRKSDESNWLTLSTMTTIKIYVPFEQGGQRIHFHLVVIEIKDKNGLIMFFLQFLRFQETKTLNQIQQNHISFGEMVFETRCCLFALYKVKGDTQMTALWNAILVIILSLNETDQNSCSSNCCNCTLETNGIISNWFMHKRNERPIKVSLLIHLKGQREISVAIAFDYCCTMHGIITASCD